MANQPDEKKGTPQRPMPPRRPQTTTMWLMLLLLLVVMLVVFTNGQTRQSEITWGMFRSQLERPQDQGGCNIVEARTEGMKIHGKFKQPPDDPKTVKPGKKKKKLQEKFVTTIPYFRLDDPDFDTKLYDALGDKYSATEPYDTTGMLIGFSLIVTIVFLVVFWIMIRRSQSMSSGMLGGFGKSPARRYEAGEQTVSFEDVAGLESVKNDLEEIVEYLKNPANFQRLGGRVPKGVLLVGPPGTGKTLLGRAVAGEAEVPFFSINGSEFIQMFVGVGASRVRDLFATAKESAPAILFIDEIDAVGRHRGTGLGGGHDEREQTLNQILGEMDGFTQSQSVIVMAATNRPDVLDPALLRPGRFDRHITVDRPTRKGRAAIFKVHSREVPLAAAVDLNRLAAATVGLTGADIRNLVNEAALWATREGKDAVDMNDFEHARDKILMGSKREEILGGEEKLMTAYHEAGHVLLSWLVKGSDPIHKVTIIPRGRALGATQVLPEEDRVNISAHHIETRLAFILGGRAAEKLQFDQYTAGCEDDLKKATALARRMVTHWGMSERLGPVAFRHGEHHPFLGKEMAEPREYSEHTARLIDEEIARILGEAADQATQTLTEHRDKLETLATTLEREEELDESEIEALIGAPAYDRKKDEKLTISETNSSTTAAQSATDTPADTPKPE